MRFQAVLISKTQRSYFRNLVNPLFLLIMIILAIVVTSLVLTTSYSTIQSNQPSIWVISGMQRVGMNDPPTAATNVVLHAARGEYEPFQVVVSAAGEDLTNVNISTSELRGLDGQVILRSNLTLYREHYVYVQASSPDQGGTNRPLGIGWYPDALIPLKVQTNQSTSSVFLPFVSSLSLSTSSDTAPKATHLSSNTLSNITLQAAPFTVKAQKNQPLWIDVFVPQDAQAGQYTGTFTVTSDQRSFEGTILLNVWDFTLPLKPSFKSSFELYTAGSTSADIELIRHKIMPKNVNPQEERQLIDKWGLNTTALGYFSGADVGTCSMKPAPSVEELKAAAATHQPDLFLFNSTADEIDACPQLYEPMKEWARNLHAAGVNNLVTMKPVPALYDDDSGTGRSAVDIWVVLPKMYDEAQEQIDEVIRRGYSVWSYNALVQDDYSPKWEIDFAPMNYRIQPGFLSQSLGLTGFYYWRADLWTSDPWNDVQTYSTDGYTYPGEAMLVYPGAQVGINGVVPSMRLKWIREGIEDFEFVEILKQRGLGEQALAITRSVALDWRNWTRDPQAIETARQQLGNLIESSTQKISDR